MWHVDVVNTVRVCGVWMCGCSEQYVCGVWHVDVVKSTCVACGRSEQCVVCGCVIAQPPGIFKMLFIMNSVIRLGNIFLPVKGHFSLWDIC